MWTEFLVLAVTFGLGFLTGAGFMSLRKDKQSFGRRQARHRDDPHISRLDVFELPKSMQPPPMIEDDDQPNSR